MSTDMEAFVRLLGKHRLLRNEALQVLALLDGGEPASAAFTLRRALAVDAGIEPIEPPAAVQEIAAAVGGTVTEAFRLPDGSGGATVSFPLPADHWIYGKDDPKHPLHGFSLNPPPMVFRMGAHDQAQVSVVGPDVPRSELMDRKAFADKIRLAGKYAVRCATMNGKETDFDPDALLQNLVVAFLGYWTNDGLSDDLWANPAPYDGISEPPPGVDLTTIGKMGAGSVRAPGEPVTNDPMPQPIPEPGPTDAERFEWCLPLLAGTDDKAADDRTVKLGNALIKGLNGRAAIDHAMGRG